MLLGSSVAIGVINVATGGIATLGDQLWGDLLGLEWVPDNTGFLAVGHPKNSKGVALLKQVWWGDYPRGALRQITNDLRDYYPVTMTGDARLFVAASAEHSSTLWIASAADLSQATQVTTGGGDWAGQAGVAWTPDDHLIYTSIASGKMGLWELYTRKFAWSRDGKRLALSRGKDRLDVLLFTDTSRNE